MLDPVFGDMALAVAKLSGTVTRYERQCQKCQRRIF
jgi:hypothetical protein